MAGAARSHNFGIIFPKFENLDYFLTSTILVLPRTLLRMRRKSEVVNMKNLLLHDAMTTTLKSFPVSEYNKTFINGDNDYLE